MPDSVRSRSSTFDFPEYFAVNAAICIENHRKRQATSRISELAQEIDGAGPGNPERIGNLHFLDEFAHVLFAIHAEADKAHVRVFFLQGIEFGHFAHAGSAPRCPEIDHHGLALELGQRMRAARQRGAA
ncbi:hypothetical protein AD428_23470 [Achromobacter sp. DMS1]|nr:hypothetical protein AD428_23470 [Achromobacter sp. DMS1]